MDVRDKLAKYLKENGIQSKWFAEKIGMNQKVLSNILNQKAPIPRKYWKRIIIMTKYEITLNDLADVHFDRQEVDIKKSNRNNS